MMSNPQKNMTFYLTVIDTEEVTSVAEKSKYIKKTALK